MAKRFITTTIFEDPWYMDLPSKYKLFWLFLITNCDHAGIWQVNYKLAAFYVGEHLEPGECERIMKGRIVKIEGDKYWFIPKFIEFQYGTVLKNTNKAVEKVIKTIHRYHLTAFLPNVTIEGTQKQGAKKELGSSLQGAKEEEKDMEEEEEEEEEEKEDSPRLLWINIFLHNAGPVEIDFVKKLVEKFGYQRAKTILYDLKKNNFHSVKTMEEALDENGNIKPRERNNIKAEGNTTSAAHEYLL